MISNNSYLSNADFGYKSAEIFLGIYPFVFGLLLDKLIFGRVFLFSFVSSFYYSCLIFKILLTWFGLFRDSLIEETFSEKLRGIFLFKLATVIF